jgi:PAS domain S-box-containing protein
MPAPPTTLTEPEASLFQSAFENAAIGMALVAPSGAWIRVNRSLCEIVGYSEAELLPGSFQEITHPDDLDLDLACVARMLSGELQSFQLEKRYIRKDGSIVWVLLSVSLVRNADGSPHLFISQIQDISARKESEVRLRKATAEIEHLRKNLLKVCAWTKRIEINGQWITVDKFLTDHLHLPITHGMSVEGARIFKEP